MSSDPGPSNTRRAPRRLHAGTATTEIFMCAQAGLLFASSSAEPAVITEFFVVLVVLVLFNGLFVAGETAIDLLKPSHGKALEAESGKKKIVFDDLMLRKASFVAACSLGSMTMRAWIVAMTVIPSVSTAGWLRAHWSVFENWSASGDLGQGCVLLIAVLVLAIPAVALNVVVGELIPKSYAAEHPLTTGLRLYGLVKVVNSVFSLPIAVFVSLAGLVTQRFGAKATFAVANRTEEEIKELLEEAEESGEIEEEEKEMVASVFEFGDTVAREVMTPRMEMEAVPIDSSLTAVARLVEETGHSRIPVFEGTDDTILGIVHAKDLLSALASGEPGIKLRNLVRPALFVPESKSLHDLLQEMRQNKAQMAIVLDEHSGTAGIVTIEDIVEEVMGEIVDEYDADLPQITYQDDRIVSDGRMYLDEVNEAIGAELHSDEFDTIGGYVFGLFGRQPKAGESVVSEGHRFTVRGTDGKRIESLDIERLPAIEEPDAESVS